MLTQDAFVEIPLRPCSKDLHLSPRKDVKFGAILVCLVFYYINARSACRGFASFECRLAPKLLNSSLKGGGGSAS